MTRADFLARIRREVARARPLLAGAVSERPRHPAHAVEIIRRELAERWPATLDRFESELERVGGVLHRVATEREVPGVIGRLARAREATRLVSWHPRALGADWSAALREQGLGVESMPAGSPGDDPSRVALRTRIAEADFGLTGADLAVAETGSLVLLSGRGRPRSTSLLPPYHVAVFDRSALVESLAQAGVYLELWHGEGPPAWRGGAVNFITGPSRTADIELTLTRGVHGPKEVHAIFVDAGLPPGDETHG